MTSLLELLVLRTSPSRDWIARTEILHSITACLKESHKTRTIFRLECQLPCSYLSRIRAIKIVLQAQKLKWNSFMKLQGSGSGVGVDYSQTEVVVLGLIPGVGGENMICPFQ